MSQMETQKCDLCRGGFCNICPQTKKNWDLDRLFEDLKCVLILQDEYESIDKVPKEAWKSAQRGNKTLKAKEKCWLCLLLQGYDVKQIESYLHLNNIGGDLSKSIYKRISFLASGKQIGDWARVPIYLEHHVNSAYTWNYRKNTYTSVTNEEIGINIKLSKTDENPINRSRIVEVFRLLKIDIREEDIEIIG
jgi:hypothetical protein